MDSVLLTAVELFSGGGSPNSGMKKPFSSKDLCALLLGFLGPGHSGAPIIELQGFPGAGTEFLQGPHLLGRAGSTGLPPRRSRVSRGWDWGLKLGFVSSSPQLGDTQEEEAVEVPSH